MDSRLPPRPWAQQRKRKQRPRPKPPLVEKSAGADRFPRLVCESRTGLLPCSRVRKHESSHLAIIETVHSEVSLGLIRKTHFNGKGRGLRGKTQSGDARCGVAQIAAAERPQRSRRIRHE